MAGNPILVTAWTLSTQTPTNGNSAPPLNTGSLGQFKAGGLILNTISLVHGLIVSSGKVGIGTITPNSVFEIASTTSGKPYMVITNAGMIGIGTTTPSVRLSVQGSLQIGNDASSCVAGNAGTIRWSGGLQLCNGSIWKLLGQ